MKKPFIVIVLVVLASAAALGIVKGCRHPSLPTKSAPAAYQGIPYNRLDMPGDIGKPEPKALRDWKKARAKIIRDEKAAASQPRR